MTSAAKLWTTCVVCGKDAVGESLISTNPLCADMNRRIVSENKQRALYRSPHGHRMHIGCLKQLQDYFNILEQKQHETL